MVADTKLTTTRRICRWIREGGSGANELLAEADTAQHAHNFLSFFYQ